MSLSDGHSLSVNALSLNDDASLLASGGDDGVICLWDPRRLCLALKCQRPQRPDAGVASLAFGGGSRHQLFAAHGCEALAWDTRSVAQPLLHVPVSDDEVNCVCLLDDERRLATADDDGCVKIFDSVTGELVRSLHKHDNIASSVLFRPGKTWQVISGGMDCRLVVTDWKGHRGEALNIFDIGELLDPELSNSASVGGLGVNPPLVHCLAASPDGEFVAAGLENGSVELFSGANRHLQHSESLFGHSAGVSALLCLPGHLLLSGGNDCECFVWNVDSDRSGGSFRHSEKINALCGRSPDKIFVADSGCSIRCCDINVAQLVGQDSDADDDTDSAS